MRDAGLRTMLLAFLLVASEARAQVTLQGPEFRVNSYTTYHQRLTQVARTSNGDFVVVWQSNVGTSYSPDYDVHGQRYASSGSPLGGEFRVNTYTTSLQRHPAVAIASNGNFIVAWDGFGSGGGTGAFVQRYASSGAPSGGEFRVSSHTANSKSYPSIGADSAGNFVVAWGEGYDQFRTHAMRFASSGAPLGVEFTVPTTAATTFSFGRSAVGMSSNGDFVIVFEMSDSSNASIGYDVFLRRFTSAGTSLTSDIEVNSYTTGKQNRPSVSVDGAGNFIVVWYDGASQGHITGQRFNNIGNTLGTAFRVNSQTSAVTRDYPSVAADSAGNFVVTWQAFGYPGDENTANVIARLFNADGSARGNEFRVNAYSMGGQFRPWVASDTSGNFVVAWEDQGFDNSQSGVFAQRSCPNLTGVTINLMSGSTNICPGQTGGTVKVTDNGGGTVGHQWGYRTSSGGVITSLGGQTGTTYVLNTADALPVGLSYVVCTTIPSFCGAITVSNEVAVFKGDVTGPSVSAPAGATVQQTLCQ